MDRIPPAPYPEADGASLNAVFIAFAACRKHAVPLLVWHDASVHDLEIQFRTSGPAPLLDALRDALGDGGRKPSRKRVQAWIRGGRVRVEGKVVEDPSRLLDAGETVDLDPASADAPSSGPPPAAAEEILHLDRHLLVVAYEPPVVVGPDDEDVARCLARALDGAAIRDLRARPVPRPDARASGLVVAALSSGAERALVDAFASGTARLTLDALAQGTDGGLEHVREDVDSIASALAALADRELAPCPVPGPGSPRTRPLLVHVSAIRLPHPRTGRELVWERDLPPTFPPRPR